MAKQRMKVSLNKPASNASSVLKSPNTGRKSKSVAASTLSQTNAPSKVTSKSVASKASSVLKDGRSSRASKSAAGSALSQRQAKRTKK